LIVALFEDERYVDLLPLVYARPTFNLKTGIKNLSERIESYFKDSRKTLFVRDYLTDQVKAEYKCPVNEPDEIDEDVLFINGSLIMSDDLYRLVTSKLSGDVVATTNGKVIAIHLSERKAVEFAEKLKGKPLSRSMLKDSSLKEIKLTDVLTINYPWDLISLNSRLIERDFHDSGFEGVRGGYLDPKTSIYGDEKNLYLGKNSSIESYVVLDVRGGPIYIGEDVEIHSHTRISGPAYIGENSRIYSALIREGTNIGPSCRVGGEVSESILHGFVNKYHSGYVGHSYVCEWVNIGAGTFVSDLKNTYGTVKVQLGGRKIDTKLMKVGCFIADHSKLSIGTNVYSGKTIGFCSHIHGLVTENVPSFTIWAKSLGIDPVELRLESAIKTERVVYGRRGIKQTEVDVELLRRIYELTVEERLQSGVTEGTFRI